MINFLDKHPNIRWIHRAMFKHPFSVLRHTKMYQKSKLMLSTAAGSSVLGWCVNCVCAPRIHFRLASAHRVTDNQGQVCIAQCVVGTFSKYCAPLFYISVRIVLTANLLCD